MLSKCWFVYVESPLQLENALAYMESKRITKALFVVRLNGLKSNDDQLLSIIKSNCGSFFTLHIGRSGYMNRLKAVLLGGGLSFVALFFQQVVVGDVRSAVIKMLRFFNIGRLAIIDDGAASFAQIKKFARQPGRKEVWVTRFEGLDKKYAQVEYLPYCASSVVFGDYTVIVGAPFSEIGLMSADEHRACIVDMISILRKKSTGSVVYYPHRYESMIYDLELDIEIVNSGVSVEEALKRQTESFPSVVASWYSTALFVISSSFLGAEVCFRDIRKIADVNVKLPESVLDVYEVLGMNDHICEL